MKRKHSIISVRWDLALRYRLIETIALWEGRLTTGAFDAELWHQSATSFERYQQLWSIPSGCIAQGGHW